MELTGLIARAKDVDGAGVSLPCVLTSVKTNLLEKIESRAGASIFGSPILRSEVALRSCLLEVRSRIPQTSCTSPWTGTLIHNTTYPNSTSFDHKWTIRLINANSTVILRSLSDLVTLWKRRERTSWQEDRLTRVHRNGSDTTEIVEHDDVCKKVRRGNRMQLELQQKDLSPKETLAHQLRAQ